jgi:serine/threonine protein kinase
VLVVAAQAIQILLLLLRLQGLSYLHSKQVVHFDLKSANLLFTIRWVGSVLLKWPDAELKHNATSTTWTHLINAKAFKHSNAYLATAAAGNSVDTSYVRHARKT